MFGVNMWDYEMLGDEIAQLSSSCFGPDGNYLKWSDFKGAFFNSTVPHEDNFQFNFPNKVVDDYVRLDVSSSASDVTAFTVCMWIKVGDQSDDGTLFSYATEDQDNELLITDYSRFKILIGGSKVTLDGVTANDDEWHHICTTWENGEGSWHFYIDTELKGSGSDFETGHVISSGGIVILGQDQDEYGGGFESDQSFNGKMFGVNMWDYEMSEDEIVQLFSRCFGPEGNYLKWGDFKGGEEGDVEVEAPTTCLPL
ncbi:unnamed protein product [Porites evermanni]|uniref:Pentraxin (PTX) domain-containing protein n=1 Tax=Porites evermanni TaxID=104178 RepID=A0ABN8MCI7_9CNID|nr:unnamed protein product [Porites evermanni]